MSDNPNISKITNSDYDELITKSLNSKNNKEKSIVDGQIIAIEN